MNWKKIILATAILGIQLNISAAVLLRINMNSGQVYRYVLADRPIITFDETQVRIQSSVMSTTLDYYGYEEVGMIDFQEVSDDYLGIDEAREETPIPLQQTFRFTDGRTVCIDGLQSKSSVRIYSADGRQIPLEIRSTENSVYISLDDLPQGLYIIKTDNQAFKIYKK